MPAHLRKGFAAFMASVYSILPHLCSKPFCSGTRIYGKDMKPVSILHINKHQQYLRLNRTLCRFPLPVTGKPAEQAGAERSVAVIPLLPQ